MAASTNTISFSSTSKGENRGLLIFVGMYNPTADGFPSVTRVYFNSIGGEEDFSFVKKEHHTTTNHHWVMEVWKLESPSAETASVVVTTDIEVLEFHAGGIAVSGINPSGMIYDIESSNVPSQNYSDVKVNAPNGGLIMGGIVLATRFTNPPAASGFAEGWNLDTAIRKFKSSYGVNFSAGSYNPLDNAVNCDRAYIVVSIAPLD